ncbi:MAG: TonB-dependent receptor [Parvularculaceae bacterium]
MRPTDALSSATRSLFRRQHRPQQPARKQCRGVRQWRCRPRYFERYGAQLRLNYNPENSDLVDLDVTTYFARNDVTEAELDSTRIVSRKVDSIGVSINNSSRFSLASGANLTFTYGGEFYRDEQEGADNMSSDGTRGGVPNATAKFYGVHPGRTGARKSARRAGRSHGHSGRALGQIQNEATGEASTDDEAVSPKVGVSYKPVKEFIIFGNWAEAFRAPSVNEIYADNVHFQIPDFSSPTFALVTNFFIPNPDLKAGGIAELGSRLSDFDSIFFFGGRPLYRQGFLLRGGRHQSHRP